MRLSRWSPLVLAALALSSPARAALTDSEREQVHDFYAKADLKSVPRVRALLARPDNAPAEVTRAFAEAARRDAFDDKHRAWVHELLFGPATLAARSDLVPIVVEGLLARGAEVAGSAGDERARADELLRIHAFVDKEIASAGTPPAHGHDASSGIRDDALKAAMASYRAHLALPVFDRARVPAALRVARLQAEIALVDLSNGLAQPGDVAAWIGADATERQALETSGMIVTGLEGAPSGKAASVMRMIEGAGPATIGASALWIGKPRPGSLSARGGVLVAQAPLDGNARVAPESLWSRVVRPSSPDASLAEIAFVLARAAATGALADKSFADAVDAALLRTKRGGDDPFLSAAVQRDALGRIESDAAPAVDGEVLLSDSIQLVLLDAPRALSSALVRWTTGHGEAMEQLTLSLTALARDGDHLRDTVKLGRVTEAGTIAPVDVTGIKGRGFEIESFSLDGRAITLTRGADGAIAKVEQDKKPIVLAAIPMGLTPTSAGEAWTGPKKRGAALELARLSGKPEVGFIDESRFLVRASSAADARDAVAIKIGATDLDARFDLKVTGAPASILVRATPASAGYAGVAITIEPGDPARAQITATDASGARVSLVAATALSKPSGASRKVAVVLLKNKLTVTIDGTALSADVPEFVGAGDFAIAPSPKGDVEISDLKIKKKR